METFRNHLQSLHGGVKYRVFMLLAPLPQQRLGVLPAPVPPGRRMAARIVASRCLPYPFNSGVPDTCFFSPLFTFYAHLFSSADFFCSSHHLTIYDIPNYTQGIRNHNWLGRCSTYGVLIPYGSSAGPYASYSGGIISFAPIP